MRNNFYIKKLQKNFKLSVITAKNAKRLHTVGLLFKKSHNKFQKTF